MQSPASGGQRIVIDLVGRRCCRGLEQASFEQRNVSCACDNGKEDDGVDRMGAGPVGHALQERRDLTIVTSWLAGVFWIVKLPPPRRY